MKEKNKSKAQRKAKVIYTSKQNTDEEQPATVAVFNESLLN